MKKHKIHHKTGPQLEKIEKLLDDVAAKQKGELPYIPETCTNNCILRQKGFCLELKTAAPKYGEPCLVNRERG